MSDRLSPPNGKRYILWGTLRACPICGHCLCYGCHPQGPCLDERDTTRALQPATPTVTYPAQASPA